jgi:hypothetical protein
MIRLRWETRRMNDNSPVGFDPANLPTEIPDNFSGYPKSISEVRAHKLRDGRLWGPRDALIDLLRDIDGGKVDPVDLVIVYRGFSDDGHSHTSFTAAGKDPLVVYGMLSFAAIKVRESQLEDT